MWSTALHSRQEHQGSGARTGRRIWASIATALLLCAAGPAQASLCDDGIDNDFDGSIDLVDPGCLGSPSTDTELLPAEEGLDPDTDGLDNLAEQSAGTDPNDDDSDDDRLLDGVETNTGVFVDASDTGT